MGVPPYIGETSEGVRIKLRVKPGARTDRLIGVLGDSLKVEINAAPEGGRANQALCKMFAELLGVPLRNIRITVGESSQNKTITIRAVGLESATAAIAAALSK
ncbi:MAG: DUF167 domain-containing protein [Acidobacteriota bacterium]